MGQCPRIVRATPCRIQDTPYAGSFIAVAESVRTAIGANWRNKADNCLAIYTSALGKHDGVEVHVQKVKFKLFGQVGIVHMTWDRPTGRYFPRLVH